MSGKPKIVGFDRTIKLRWMQYAAELASQNLSPKEINAKLEDFLLPDIKGKEARRKTRTVLLAIWVKINNKLQGLHSDAFSLLNKVPKSEHIVIFWGVSMAVHPFFGEVASIVGRLISLQGTVSSLEVQRRIKEIYGERQTVSRAVQRLLRTYVDWGILLDTGKVKEYAPNEKIHLTSSQLISWLIEALIFFKGDTSVQLNTIAKSPVFFPFSFKEFSPGEIDRNNKRLEVIQHGLNENMVLLKKL